MNMTIYLPSIHTNGTPPVEPAVTYGPVGFGVGCPWQNAEADNTWYQRVLDLLQPPWWYDWQFHQIGRDGYVPMLWAMRRDGYYAEAMSKARAYPRTFWLMGNEPEAPEQSATDPSEAAETMRRWMYDTGVRFAAPGVILNNRGFAWLDDYLAFGGPVPMAWHVHNYAQTVEAWSLWLDEFNHWMYDNKVLRPVIVSETAIDKQDMNEQVPLLAVIGNALSAHKVQAVAWFSAEYASHSWTNLTEGDELTSLGKHFVEMNRNH